MPISSLIINPKDYHLQGSQDHIKNLNPYFEVSSSSYSNFSSVKRYVNGKLQEDQSFTKRNGKAHVDLNLRDANSGELLGKGRIEYDPFTKKPLASEEKVVLKNRLGNEIGSATVEVKPQKQQRMALEFDNDDDFGFGFGFGRGFNRMLRDSDKMFRNSDSLFDSFFGGRRNLGLGFLEDFEPIMMLEEDHSKPQPQKKAKKSKNFSKKAEKMNFEKKDFVEEKKNEIPIEEEEIKTIQKEKIVEEEKPDYVITDESL